MLIFAGWACKSASVTYRHKQAGELSKQIGEGNGSAGDTNQEQLVSGHRMTWTDNATNVTKKLDHYTPRKIEENCFYFSTLWK